MTDPVAGEVSVRSINQEILGMDGPNHLISQILPSIAVINPSSYRLHALNNRLTFSSVGTSSGRLGIFAAQKGSQQRAVILLLPPAGTPDRLLICITQGFAQASRNLEPLGWSNPLSPAFIKFVLLKHVINRFGAQTLAASDDTALLYIVRARGNELGPFAHDGPFVEEALTQLVALTGNAFSFDHVEAFTFSSGVSDFNVFIPSVSSILNIEAVYGIDPAQAVPIARPGDAIRKQYLSGQTGGPAAGFEYLGLDSWINEWRYPDRTTFPDPWPFNYLHNHVMPSYILNLALST
ncbi:MAG TPA: hypothetical protein VKF84_09225 [Candidatus Sulfotelmatobacter sp.]|nr:hypothetical protein [Candidatus Sulfotelmatobacter sp.]